MEKQYDLTEEESQGQMVKDDTVLEYEATCSTGSTLRPYTMEEIDARIAQAESEFEVGLGIPSDEVFTKARAYVEELNARIDEAELQFARGEYYTSEEVHRDALEFLNSRRCS